MPRALRVAAQGAHGRHRAQPSGTATRYLDAGGADGRGALTDHGRHPDRGHPAARPAADRAASAGHLDHHPGVPLPVAHQRCPPDSAQHPLGDRGRDPLDGRNEAGGAPCAQPGATHRAHHKCDPHPDPPPQGGREIGAAADRALRHPAAPDRDSEVPGRGEPRGHHHRCRPGQADGDHGRGPSRGHVRSRTGDPLPDPPHKGEGV